MENEKKMTQELAAAEIQKWLDFKKVKPFRRKEKVKEINLLTGAIEDGTLTLKEDFTLVLNLSFPLGADGKGTPTLSFKPRIKAEDIAERMKVVDTKDMGQMMQLYACALTGQTEMMLQRQDTEDLAVTNAIASFFY